MAQSIQYLSYKQEDLNWVPRPYIYKLGKMVPAYDPALGSGDIQIPGDHWQANLAKFDHSWVQIVGENWLPGVIF